VMRLHRPTPRIEDLTGRSILLEASIGDHQPGVDH